MVEIYFETVQQVWADLQRGLLPDFGGWNYMIMAVLIMAQGRISAMIGGVAAATGYLNLGIIILIAVLARMVVDLFWYRVGATGLIDRIGRHAAPYRKHAGHISQRLNDHPTRLVLLSKTVGGLAVPVTIAIGNARVPLRRWLPASVAGELLWTLPLLLLGFYATDALTSVKGGIMYLTLGMTVIFVAIQIVKMVKTRLKTVHQSS